MVRGPYLLFICNLYYKALPYSIPLVITGVRSVCVCVCIVPDTVS